MKPQTVKNTINSFDREKKIKKVKMEIRKPKYKKQLFITED